MIDFIDRYGRSFEDIAKRISRMLFDSDDEVFFLQDEDKYQIGHGNDYRLLKRHGGGFRFSVRYRTEECISAMKFMLEHHVSVQICEKEA